MATATTYPPLHVVQDPPTVQERMGMLLRARAAARQALDLALSLPRAATGWALRQLHTLVGAAGDNHVAAWLTARTSAAVTFVRQVGFVPLAATVLSTPRVWAGATRLLRAASGFLARLGHGLWTGLDRLLHRAGPVGVQVSNRLTSATATVRRVTNRMLTHAVVRTVTSAGFEAAQLVRPISRAVLAHRVISLLTPGRWTRALVQVLVFTVLLSTRLLTTAPASGGAVDVRPIGNEASSAGIERLVDPVPATNGSPAGPAADGTDETHQAVPVGQVNRAARRAQQQERARARRAGR
ncbi:hypothetical protein [Ornithinimicrobium cryptoxanthini]|uniref:Uncharacterized protein n=1 Tax=Ornithinimicrobium cryptoxanthini TaxID=2934161 RepID=A0ABY4YFH0_9MICO|nr:hypothetical protein [Ornithinimicrobium cryptoxanthini]USQ75347.1 hypothetical protein NF557_12035 [Ornithinimicrobium cryptoxanthini]